MSEQRKPPGTDNLERVRLEQRSQRMVSVIRVLRERERARTRRGERRDVRARVAPAHVESTRSEKELNRS